MRCMGIGEEDISFVCFFFCCVVFLVWAGFFILCLVWNFFFVTVLLLYERLCICVLCVMYVLTADASVVTFLTKMRKMTAQGTQFLCHSLREIPGSYTIDFGFLFLFLFLFVYTHFFFLTFFLNKVLICKQLVFVCFVCLFV